MVITSDEMANFIGDDDCDFYDEHIEQPLYSSVWTYQPNRTLGRNRRTKCRRLRMLRQTDNPIWRGELGLNEYEYRSMEPRYRSRRLELFSPNLSGNSWIMFAFLLIITIFFMSQMKL